MNGMDRIHGMACLLLLTSLTYGVDAQAERGDAQRSALWNGHAPIGDGKFEDADAWITVHRPRRAMARRS